VSDWTWRTLQAIALQESRALRAFAKAGKNPRCAPTKFPWHEGYIDIFTPITAAEREAEPCGTDAAYQVHLRRKEVPCDRCKRAHAIDMRERRMTAKDMQPTD